MHVFQNVLATLGYTIAALGVLLCLTIVGIIPGIGMLITGLLMAAPLQRRLKAERTARI